MTLLEECIRDSLPIWRKCLDTAFIRGVIDGSLPEECFKGYTVDDSLYLREYAKVFAWGIIHSGTMNEMRAYYSLLAYVNESEDATRLYYLKRYGLRDEDIQRLPLRPANQAYVDTMLRAASEGGGAPECMMACLPCMLSYCWLFKEVMREHPEVRDTVYWPFVSDYVGEGYERVCQNWIDFTNEACRDITPERAEKCREVFMRCSEHELEFWHMSEQPRTDV